MIIINRVNQRARFGGFSSGKRKLVWEGLENRKKHKERERIEGCTAKMVLQKLQ